MRDAQDTEIGGYLAGLMALVLRASPGPFTINSTAAGTHEATSSATARLVGTFNRRADAELFARALAALRVETAVLLEVLALHRDDGTGRCAQDGQVVPCTTCRIFVTQLTTSAEEAS